MKARLDTEVTLTKVTVFLDTKINWKDEKTHEVAVEGYVSHDYLWEKEKRQPFEFMLHADGALCDAIVKLLEETMQLRDAEQFPKEIGG